MTPSLAETFSFGRRVRRQLCTAVLVLLAAAPVVTAIGCSDDGESREPNTCVGGVMLGGQCQPKCDPDKCVDGNVCFNNQCRLVCTAHTDCQQPHQACLPATDDDALEGDGLLVWMAGATGVCQDTGRLPVAGRAMLGDSCPNGTECDGWVCPNGLECDPDACHDGSAPHPELCVRDDAACGDSERCNIGTCQGTGAPCTFNACPGECEPMVCMGHEGDGDSTAYCSHHDCQQDADCPAGWHCGVTRDPHDICGPTCNGGSCTDDGSDCQVDGDCQKGNNWLCGETSEGCIDPADFTANGRSYFEGALCLMRRTCMKNESCAPCVTSQDCSLFRDQICVPFGSGNACARFCQTDEDCVQDEACWPAHATCDVDTQLPCPNVGCPQRPCVEGTCAAPPGEPPGAACDTDADCLPQTCIPRNVCLPRDGACRTEGGGFCRHCVDDTDCAGIGTTEACMMVTRGQYACFDLSYPNSCTGSDATCPVAPSGAHGECLDEGEGVSSSSWAYHLCDFPYDNSSDRFTCWP